MPNNLGRFTTDLDQLIKDGENLLTLLLKELAEDEASRRGLEYKEANKASSFTDKYQTWYSEALAIIKLLLPDRLSDFTKLYEKPKGRKHLTEENYAIEDFLQGLYVPGAWSAVLPMFKQQLAILAAVTRRLESSLFDIKQLVQSDIFDSELEQARELNRKGFARGAGAIAGVVLEKHLAEVARAHGFSLSKRDPSINDWNQLLKTNNVLEIKDWRFIQRLGDLRNLADHNKGVEPNESDIEELILGVEKVSKTIF